MSKIDAYESELLSAFEKGALKSSGDLQDIQVRALEEGMPYQTLIASVLHKYLTGRLSEHGDKDSSEAARPKRAAARRANKTDM